MKRTNVEREALFVRLKKNNKDFLVKKTEKTKRETKSWYTTQDTVDDLVAGYKRLKKKHPKLASKYF